MLWPVFVVAAGLLLTLIGIAISIWINPPSVTFDWAAHAEEQCQQNPGGQFRASLI